MAIVAEASRKSQVQEYSDKLSEHATALQSSISDLEKRLQGVLRQEPEGERVSEKMPTLVPLAEFLMVNGDVVYSAYGRILSILERLEL